MRKGFFIICALFVILTGFNQQERVVEQSNVDLLGRASVGVKAPVIVLGLRNVSVNEGGIATFIAELSEPVKREDVTWLKDGVPIVPNAFVKIYTDNTTVTLVINLVIIRDAGKYTVVVENDAGKVTSTAELTVRIE